MKLLDKPLQALTAQDLMTTTVLTIHDRMSARCAARILSQAGVTGAPVIDDAGCCVGVLSTTDFLKRAGHPIVAELFASHVEYDWQIPEQDEAADECVCSLMTPDPVAVSRDAPLGDVARRMLDAHIHRVIVADEDGRLVGIISTIDILAAVAHYAAVEAAY